MNCATCYSRDLVVVLDMGDMALAGAFLKPDGFGAERRYPLRLGFCRACYAVQVVDRIAKENIFGSYFYRSSTSAKARAHFRRYADELVERFSPQTVIEIGCNDGVMLKPLAERVENVIGVDPSDAAADVRIPRVAVWRSFFDQRSAKVLPKADVVIANNVLAHAENLGDIMHGIQRVLNPDGVLVFECHYLGSVLDGQYDAIYHEHVFYHSLIALDRHFAAWGLQVFDVKPQPVHGGSMRFYACRPGKRPETAAVAALRAQEIERGLHEEETYRRFAVRCLDHRRGLMGLMNRLARERATVVGYGAAGRANTLMQWCGFTEGHLAYVVDDCEAKHGFYTPGTHYEIRPWSAYADGSEYADYVLALAWTYLDEIAPKVSAPLIVPFPEPRIVAGAVLEAA